MSLGRTRKSIKKVRSDARNITNLMRACTSCRIKHMRCSKSHVVNGIEPCKQCKDHGLPCDTSPSPFEESLHRILRRRGNTPRLLTYLVKNEPAMVKQLFAKANLITTDEEDEELYGLLSVSPSTTTSTPSTDSDEESYEESYDLRKPALPQTPCPVRTEARGSDDSPFGSDSTAHTESSKSSHPVVNALEIFSASPGDGGLTAQDYTKPEINPLQWNTWSSHASSTPWYPDMIQSPAGPYYATAYNGNVGATYNGNIDAAIDNQFSQSVSQDVFFPSHNVWDFPVTPITGADESTYMYSAPSAIETGATMPYNIPLEDTDAAFQLSSIIDWNANTTIDAVGNQQTV